jgi:hypothetical protein
VNGELLKLISLSLRATGNWQLRRRKNKRGANFNPRLKTAVVPQAR